MRERGGTSTNLPLLELLAGHLRSVTCLFAALRRKKEWLEILNEYERPVAQVPQFDHVRSGGHARMSNGAKGGGFGGFGGMDDQSQDSCACILAGVLPSWLAGFVTDAPGAEPTRNIGADVKAVPLPRASTLAQEYAYSYPEDEEWNDGDKPATATLSHNPINHDDISDEQRKRAFQRGHRASDLLADFAATFSSQAAGWNVVAEPDDVGSENPLLVPKSLNGHRHSLDASNDVDYDTLGTTEERQSSEQEYAAAPNGSGKRVVRYSTMIASDNPLRDRLQNDPKARQNMYDKILAAADS